MSEVGLPGAERLVETGPRFRGAGGDPARDQPDVHLSPVRRCIPAYRPSGLDLSLRPNQWTDQRNARSSLWRSSKSLCPDRGLKCPLCSDLVWLAPLSCSTPCCSCLPLSDFCYPTKSCVLPTKAQLPPGTNAASCPAAVLQPDEVFRFTDPMRKTRFFLLRLPVL
jgi:hypothetical protein